jgi:methyl-accepting chemotaxis protein
MLRPTLGIKLGVSFVLTLLVLLATGTIALVGVERIDRHLERIVDTGWQAAEQAGLLNLELQRAFGDVQTDMRRIEAASGDGARTALERADSSLRQLLDGPYAERVSGLESAVAEARDQAETLYRDQQAWAQALDEIRETVAAAQALMVRLGHLGNFQISNLEDAFLRNEALSWENDIEPSWRFVLAGYDARVALYEAVAQAERLLNGDPGASREALFDQLALLDEAIGELVNSPLSARAINAGPYKGQSYAAALDGFRVQYAAAVEALMARHAAFQRDHALFNERMHALLAQVDAFRASVSAQVASQRQQIMDQVDRQRLLISLALAVGTLLTLAAIGLSYRLLVRPLRQLSQRMDEIAAGEGDLRAEMPVRGRDELADLALSFNRFVGRIRELVDDISRMGRELATGAGHQQQQAAQTLAAVRTQQQESAQVATAVDQLRSTVEEIARRADEAARHSRQVQASSESGQQLMESNRAAIARLEAQFERTAEVVNQLALESSHAGTILNVIEEVAEQTSLLALNAAIEAARAGEQGRGFAVVAEEVRALALRTQQSAGEIHRVLDGLRARAGDAVQSSDAGRELLGHNVELSDETAAALVRIFDEVDRISQLNLAIAAATEEQAQVTQATQQSLERIVQATRHTETGAADSAGQAERVEAQSAQVLSLLSRFRT